MNDVICKAIGQHLTLRFVYKGSVRWVEPHTYGLRRNGAIGLSAWQLTGGSAQAFRLFLEREMQSLQVDEPFASEREGYVRGDAQFAQIYAEL